MSRARNTAGSTASLQRRIQELENHLLAVQTRLPSPTIIPPGDPVPLTSHGSTMEAELGQLNGDGGLLRNPPVNSSPSWKIQRVSREGVDEFRSVTNYPLDLDSTLNGIGADIDGEPQPPRREPLDEENHGQTGSRNQAFGLAGDSSIGTHGTWNQMYRDADDLQPNKKRRMNTESSDGRSRFDQEPGYGEQASSASRNNDYSTFDDLNLKPEPSKVTARLVAEILIPREIDELYKQ